MRVQWLYGVTTSLYEMFWANRIPVVQNQYRSCDQLPSRYGEMITMTRYCRYWSGGIIRCSWGRWSVVFIAWYATAEPVMHRFFCLYVILSRDLSGACAIFFTAFRRSSVCLSWCDAGEYDMFGLARLNCLEMLCAFKRQVYSCAWSVSLTEWLWTPRDSEWSGSSMLCMCYICFGITVPSISDPGKHHQLTLCNQ